MTDMIVGWFKNFISAILPERIGQGAQAFESKSKAKLIDVTDGVYLTEEARKRSLELLTIVRKGSVHLNRFLLWLNVRRKAKGQVADFFDLPEIMEEVTEKIVEAADIDPFYKKLFR